MNCYDKLLNAVEYAERNNSFNRVNVVMNAKNVAVFGLGTYFREAFESQNMKKKFNVSILCDNDESKWGKYYEGIKCIRPEELKMYDDLVVIIMLGNTVPVEHQLKQMNIKYVTHTSLMLDYTLGMNTGKDWFALQKKSIIDGYNAFCDDESKRVYAECLVKRMAPELSETPWNEIYCNQPDYFNGKYIKLDDNEVYVDCGAYDGDSVKQFINTVKKYNKIYAFEIDGLNFRKMTENLKNFDNVIQYNCGVWSHDDEIECGTGTSTNEPAEGISVYKTEANEYNHINLCKVCALDNLFDTQKITLIKMDIEGSEIEGLKGAAKIIKKYKPRLAICVYHRTSDFWEIPAIIKEINKEYKFGLMHHYDKSEWGTVLYAF